MFQSYENDEESNPMPSAMEAILQTFMQSLGGFGDHWNGLESTNHSFIGKVCDYYSLTNTKVVVTFYLRLQNEFQASQLIRGLIWL